jgi:hypothetical protein
MILISNPSSLPKSGEIHCVINYRQQILFLLHVTASLSFIYLNHQKHDSNLTNTGKVRKSLGFDLHGDLEAEEGVPIVVKQSPNTCTNVELLLKTTVCILFCCNSEYNFKSLLF